MDYYFFLKHILEKHQLRKRQKHLSWNVFSSPQITGRNQINCGVFLKNSKICKNQRYGDNLKRNWKNSVCVGVKNFANL